MVAMVGSREICGLAILIYSRKTTDQVSDKNIEECKGKAMIAANLTQVRIESKCGRRYVFLPLAISISICRDECPLSVLIWWKLEDGIE